MKYPKRILQLIFYAFIFTLILSRAVSSGINHDENQFISPGQLLADHGLLPYRDYPYTHMPYAIPFYALAVSISPFDYLATRLLGVVTWMACLIVMLAMFRLISRNSSKPPATSDPSWTALVGEFVLMLVLVDHPLSIFLQGSTLNHLFGTLFALLALLMFMRGASDSARLSAHMFWSGIFVSIASFMRFNYASLVPVLCALWVVYTGLFIRTRWIRLQARFLGGVLLAALPAMILAAMAPVQFYYGNFVYIQLNTLYYRGLRVHDAMDVESKVIGFLGSLRQDPVNIVLYAIAIVAGLYFVTRLARRRNSFDMMGVAATAFAGGLFLSTFAPTPTQIQYFFAPLPFIVILIALGQWKLYERSAMGWAAILALLATGLLFGLQGRSPISELEALLHPDAWPPLQVHEFASGLSVQQRVPRGRILAILPMIPSEAGYASYPFTATGPFSWRTSVLLSARRRAEYGVTSPQELPTSLDADPPVAILTGLLPPKAGFSYEDPGSLERPFAEYAQRNGYTPIPLAAEFLHHSVTLWIRTPVGN